MKTKIELNDSVLDVMTKMSEGNPGALTVCLSIIKNGEAIDPDGATGGLGPILSLDTLGIYGAKIWMLFKDVCQSDIAKMVAVLRGWQLGILSDSQVKHAIENRGDGIVIPDVLSSVKAQLPNFKLE